MKVVKIGSRNQIVFVFHNGYTGSSSFYSILISVGRDLYNDRQHQYALLQTIGHELAHRHDVSFSDNPFVNTWIQWCANYYSKHNLEYRFLMHINEIHADFEGCQIALNASRQDVLRSCEFKKNHTSECSEGKKSKRLFSHPTWDERIFCLRYFDFTEDLIDHVAQNMSYSGSGIEKAKNHFHSLGWIFLSPRHEER